MEPEGNGSFQDRRTPVSGSVAGRLASGGRAVIASERPLAVFQPARAGATFQAIPAAPRPLSPIYEKPLSAPKPSGGGDT